VILGGAYKVGGRRRWTVRSLVVLARQALYEPPELLNQALGSSDTVFGEGRLKKDTYRAQKRMRTHAYVRIGTRRNVVVIGSPDTCFSTPITKIPPNHIIAGKQTAVAFAAQIR
jgi:hypothetical protein